MMLFFLVLACVPAECEQECIAYGAFFDACGTDGTLVCDGGEVFATCVVDAERAQECYELDNSSDCDDFYGSGITERCTSGLQATSSCNSLTALSLANASEKKREEHLDECEAKDEYEELLAAKDCAGMCRYFGYDAYDSSYFDTWY